MEDLLLFVVKSPDFAEFVQRFGYIGIFLWFISFDQINPIPEEFSLLLLGYLCANHVIHPVPAGLLSMAGFITVDIAYYGLSRTGNKLMIKKSGKPRFAWAEPYKDKLKTNMFKTISILNFIPRMRMLPPILAGSLKLSFKKFLLFDTISLSFFTLLYLSLGMIFENSLSIVMTKMKKVQHLIFFGVIFLIAVVIIIMEIKRRKNPGNLFPKSDKA